ncbi:MAG: M20/M25/M40 family metallo-hydrolase [Flavobacteriaceae bacterium]
MSVNLRLLVFITLMGVNIAAAQNKKDKMINKIIDTTLIHNHLYTLASDKMQGRGSGTPGIELAAQYIEGQYKKIGLKTFQKADSYRQNFTHKGTELFNVIGVLEGKKKPEEYVVISAHYDHLGIVSESRWVEGDSIANGADDDASGTAAVMALAKYWKKRGDNARTLVFVAFTAEEWGLVGSNYFGKQVNPEKYVAGINIEMIGKDSSYGPNTAWLTGFDRSDFGKIIQKNLEGTGYTLYPDPYPKFRLFFRSDNASLARLGIPSHTFSTDPIDKDPYYHTVKDEVSTLDMEIVTATVKAIAKGTESIIMGEDTPSRVVITENK